MSFASGRNAALALSILSLAPLAHGAALITNPGNGGTAGATPGERHFQGTIGYQFTVGPANLTATALGLYDGAAVGFVDEHTISVYLASDVALPSPVPLATAVVGSATPGTLLGFSYTNLTVPLILTANTSYVVLSTFQGAANSDPFLDLDDGDLPQGTALPTAGTESYDTGARFSTDAGGFIGKVGFGAGNTVSGYGGPNIQYSVPEPGTLGVLGLGATLLLRRRKHLGKTV